jgi:hypothetical protein
LVAAAAASSSSSSSKPLVVLIFVDDIISFVDNCFADLALFAASDVSTFHAHRELFASSNISALHTVTGARKSNGSDACETKSSLVYAGTEVS